MHPRSCAQTNFNKMVKDIDPGYGIRDVAYLKPAAERSGLTLAEEVFHEASNNWLLGLQKRA